MSFRSERQRAIACRLLLERVKLGKLWTDDGPTERAVVVLDGGGEYLSSGEVLMLRAAFDVWNGMGGLTLDRALGVLDNGNLAALGSLLVAISRSDVDRWIGLAEIDTAAAAHRALEEGTGVGG